MITQETIEEVKRRLVKTYDPLEIYLFGSYAWGHPDEESDLDLCVVVENIKTDHYRAMAEGHKALVGMHIPKDILVLTKKEFDEKSALITNLFYEIRRKGKKIYARA